MPFESIQPEFTDDPPVVVVPVPPADDGPSEHAMTLDNFIRHHNRVVEAETMGAFYSREKNASRLDDLPSAYLARLAAFQTEAH